MRLAQALRLLYSSARQLHFAQLRPSWWQRLLRRHCAMFQNFCATADRATTAAAAVRQEAQSLEAPFGDHNREARRVLAEFVRAADELGKEVDNGVGLLQPMCEDINRQRKRGGGDRPLAALAEAAQSYTQSFKRLEQVGSMAHDIGVRAHTILERRGALLAQVRADMEAFHTRWARHIGELCDAVRARATRLHVTGNAVEAHEDAMKRLEAALDACGALHGEEHFLTKQLEVLRTTLAERP
jgi:hypothetical protein